MRVRVLLFTAACLAAASCGQTAPVASAPEAPSATAETMASGKPTEVGACVETTVVSTGPRLEGVPESGSSIQYANGMSQVEYDVLPGITNSQPGDAVRVCLVSVPENCPPGDDRGRMYSATNTRTGETWAAPDSQHSCGGA